MGGVFGRFGTFWDFLFTFVDVLGRFGTLMDILEVLGCFGMFWDVPECFETQMDGRTISGKPHKVKNTTVRSLLPCSIAPFSV